MTYTFGFNAMLTILLILVPLVMANKSAHTTAVSYALVLTLGGLYGFSVAFLQVTLYGLAGPNPLYTSAFMVGIGLSGIIVNSVRILLLFIIPDKTIQAYIFFGLATVFLAYCAYLSN